MNAFYTKPSLLDLSVAHEQSEQDYNINIWEPIIEAILRVIINQRFIDIANIEVGKKATTTKVKDDHFKLLLEAKTIIQKAISSFSFIYPPSFTVTSFQICGIKSDLLQTSLGSPSNFTTQRISKRIRIPLRPCCDRALYIHLTLLLRQLMVYKDKVESVATLLKKEVNKALDRRSSFGPILSSSYKKNLECYHNWLNVSYLGTIHLKIIKQIVQINKL
ncbi:uncharacterized protein EV154DRAFT_429126 [Mucor mucedo]|uniref:uncharacterized protein n=1 Tax=Mucor mucedo TaxID=29922 RepID=UPI0022205803|nr:uncharacterized protein EV154DRAFT_429126 [Mucor mucedo]KAI7879325.1 hypothetical protein EV154DRAFT_429126 [Mucor mucedo]